MAFYAYLMKLFDPLSAMADIDTRLSRALASLQRVYNLTLIEAGNGPVSAEEIAIDRSAPAVCFEGVSFGYSAGLDVLKDIQLRVEPGEKVLIAGASGSGKSTLLKLASRQYQRYRGRIAYFGAPSQDWTRSRFRTLVGVAPRNHPHLRMQPFGKRSLRPLVDSRKRVTRPAMGSCAGRGCGQAQGRRRHSSGLRRSSPFRRRAATYQPCPGISGKAGTDLAR